MGGDQSFVRVFGWAVLFCVLVPGGSLAQSARPAQQSGDDVLYRPYVGVSVLSSTSPPGPDDYHYASPLPGGTTPAIVGTVGIFVGPLISIGAELTFSSLSAVQTFDHYLYNRSLVTYRETIASFVVRAHPTRGRVSVQPLGGVGFVHGNARFTERLVAERTYPVRILVAAPDESYVSEHFAALVGADIVAAVTPRFAITGSLRGHLVSGRYGSPGNSGFVGIGDNTFQVGGGVRWTFARQ